MRMVKVSSALTASSSSMRLQGALFRVHGGLPQLVGVHLAQALIAVDVHLGVGVVAPQLGGDPIPLLVGEGHPRGLAPGQLVEGGHGGVDVALLDEGPHEAEEEGEQQGTDVGAVHIGIGHDDDLVVAQLARVELVPDAGAQGGDDGLELVVAVDLVGPGLLHVEHLAPQGEDGLEAGVPALGGGAAGGIALDDVEFGELRVDLIAVPQLVWHGGAAQGGLTPDGLPGLAGGLPGPRGGEGLVQDGLAHGGVLLQITPPASPKRCC